MVLRKVNEQAPKRSTLEGDDILSGSLQQENIKFQNFFLLNTAIGIWRISLRGNWREPDFLKSRSSPRSRHSQRVRRCRWRRADGRRSALGRRHARCGSRGQHLRQGADAGDVVAVDVAQQFHAFPGQHAGQRLPAFEREVPFLKAVAAFGAVPGIDEPAEASFPIAPPTAIFMSLIWRLGASWDQSRGYMIIAAYAAASAFSTAAGARSIMISNVAAAPVG